MLTELSLIYFIIVYVLSLSPSPLPQPIVEAGCLVALSEQLKDSANIPEVVLSEVSAALAVLASDGEYLSVSLSLCLSVSLSRPHPSLSLSHFFFYCTELARKQIMELYSGNFYQILIKLTESPYTEVQYNCAGVIGHLAINRKS